MAVALHPQGAPAGIITRRASVPTTYRSGGAGGRISSVRSARDSGHLRVVAGVAASRPAATPAVYRRRRLVLGGIVAALVGAIIGIGIVGEADADMATGANISAPQSLIAQPGDTLWAIARRIVPEGNIVDLVDELVRLNGQTIQAGQVVRLPG